MTKINPYINFNGNAEEAFTFYKSSRQCKFLTDAGEYSSNADADSGVKRQHPSRQ